ncbi:MAG: hypothetical protein IJ668_11955 [Selenomonadaceae bacterium]|nr:hypothetical protein [Selenomonadaceae bacterium]
MAIKLTIDETSVAKPQAVVPMHPKSALFFLAESNRLLEDADNLQEIVRQYAELCTRAVCKGDVRAAEIVALRDRVVDAIMSFEPPIG